jgi:hypothetical protein
MPPDPDVPTTSVLLIDGNDTDRANFAAQLTHRSPDYKILEAPDGEQGLSSTGPGGRLRGTPLELPDQSATRYW